MSFRGDADRSGYPVWAFEGYASKVPGNAPNSSSVSLQLITSNLLFSDWVNVFQNNLLTAALLDRITHKAVILNMS
ncbi:ATP-binding protein [Methanospirillum sp.]|uniref:ATP-binding protein n=1 Tax=Methanospirillum sp. TaxID=45200 RepID=UPI003444ECF5